MERGKLKIFGKPIVLVAVFLLLPGCSLGVLTGKMLFGDPKVTAPFKSMTSIDLVKDEKTVLVICTTPDFVDTEFSSLRLDLTEGVIRRLKRAQIKVIESGQVATWLDDRGGRWEHVNDLVYDFDADVIVHIEINNCSFREENSPTMFRGRCTGTAYGYEVLEVGDQKGAQQVFVSEFNSVYPPHLPVSDERMTEKSFHKQYVDRVADQVSRFFYDYQAGWDF